MTMFCLQDSVFPHNNQVKFAIMIFWYPKQCTCTVLWDLVKIVNRAKCLMYWYQKLYSHVFLKGLRYIGGILSRFQTLTVSILFSLVSLSFHVCIVNVTPERKSFVPFETVQVPCVNTRLDYEMTTRLHLHCNLLSCCN